MSRDKQIEEMAKVIHDSDLKGNDTFPMYLSDCLRKHGGTRTNEAVALYNAGYRKSTDVAEEIFAEIERSIFRLETPYQTLYCIDDGFIAELKKKYTDVAERREVSENNTVRCFHPSVTDQKGEGN